jgi:hypothetical protein
MAMGHSGSVSRLVVACGKSVTQTRELEKLKKMLKCDTDPIHDQLFLIDSFSIFSV